MRIRKETQKAILFCLYLATAGRSSAEKASTELGGAHNEFCDLARALTERGVLDRDPDGRYSLRGHPTLRDVYETTQEWTALREGESKGYTDGKKEHSVLLFHASLVDSALKPLLDKTIRGLCNDFILADMGHKAEKDFERTGGSS